MLTRLASILACSALGIALAAMPAAAVETRVGVFAIACNGTSEHVEFTASGLIPSPPPTPPAPATRFVQGAEVTVIDTRRALLSLVVRLQDDETKELIRVGPGSTHERNDFTGFFRVTLNQLGQVPVSIDAACTPGAPLPAIVTVYFF
jgi:hypothetical protein